MLMADGFATEATGGGYTLGVVRLPISTEARAQRKSPSRAMLRRSSRRLAPSTSRSSRQVRTALLNLTAASRTCHAMEGVASAGGLPRRRRPLPGRQGHQLDPWLPREPREGKTTSRKPLRPQSGARFLRRAEGELP